MSKIKRTVIGNIRVELFEGSLKEEKVAEILSGQAKIKEFVMDAILEKAEKKELKDILESLKNEMIGTHEDVVTLYHFIEKKMKEKE